jgi:hypothetical protein
MLTGTQLQLFDVGHSPRPQRFNHEILEFLLDELTPRAFTIVGSMGDDWNSIRDDLQLAVEFLDAPHAIEKCLVEDCCWDVSVELRGILSEVEDIRNGLHERQVKRWVLQNGITPKYSRGQRVTFQRQEKGPDNETIWSGEDTPYVGEILDVLEDTAEYLVLCKQKVQNEILLPFETVQKLD